MQYRVLQTLEDGKGGFYYPGTILAPDQVAPSSAVILMERYILMSYIDPAVIAALPESE
jgi:hypothetical protein